jgi:hypothetical protein
MELWCLKAADIIVYENLACSGCDYGRNNFFWEDYGFVSPKFFLISVQAQGLCADWMKWKAAVHDSSRFVH